MKPNYHIRRGGVQSQALHNVLFQNNLPEPSLWNSQIGRRAFLKKTGAATVGTVVVLNGLRLEILAQESCSATAISLTGNTTVQSPVFLATFDTLVLNGIDADLRGQNTLGEEYLDDFVGAITQLIADVLDEIDTPGGYNFTVDGSAIRSATCELKNPAISVNGNATALSGTKTVTTGSSTVTSIKIEVSGSIVPVVTGNASFDQLGGVTSVLGVCTSTVSRVVVGQIKWHLALQGTVSYWNGEESLGSESFDVTADSNNVTVSPTVTGP